jgi:PadR family transcriptional regulator, regulatory protein PadR
MSNFKQGQGRKNRNGFPGGRGRGRFRARLMEPIVLLALKKQPAHGYTLLAELENFGLGGLDPSMLYRLLRDMESRELVASTWEEKETQGPPRRMYEITPTGLDEIEIWRQHLEHQRDLLQAVLDSFEQTNEK